MTAVEKTKAISDLLANNLPALLAAYVPILDDFDVYDNRPPLRAEDNEVAVYIDSEGDSTDSDDFSAIIQIQLQKKGSDGKPTARRVDDYHSVIMPFLRSNLKGSTVDMMQRNNLIADVWPLDVGSSSAFIYYFVDFNTPLDDCEDDS